MYLFQKVEEMMYRDHDARQAVCEFVLKERTQLYKYTIGEIAERTFTSKATVVRFAKSLGYEGWKEFKKAYIEEIRFLETQHGYIDVNFPVQPHDSTENIIESMKALQIESIQDTSNLLKPEIIDQAVEYLLKANYIMIFGLSPNQYIGELFKRRLMTIGRHVSVVSSGEYGIASRSLGPNDCAIVISYSGNNPESEPQKQIRTLKEREVPMVGITSGTGDYMREQIDCILTMSSREKLYTKISNFSTEESLSFILNVLFTSYFVKDYHRNSLFKIDSSKVLESRRDSKNRDTID